MTGTLWIACMAGVATESLVARQARPLIEAALVGAAVTMLALVIGLALPGQLGLGDVSLFGVIALSLGWLGLDTAVVGLLVGISVQSAAAFANVLRTRTMRRQMPLGPALLTGWLVAIVLERV
jgi:leader peptidase (prepilin peptidase)/N-methyltransferase